jgi:hypothetical protein
MIPAAIDGHSTGVSGGWYRVRGWRASEHASEGAARRKRLLPTAADPFFMGQLQGRLVVGLTVGCRQPVGRNRRPELW